MTVDDVGPLVELPFIHDATIIDDSLQLDTPTGPERLTLVRGPLTGAMLRRVLSSAAPEGHVVLSRAPIGPRQAKRLRDAQVSYLDGAGNMHIRIGDRYFAWVERPPTRAPVRAMRAPGYQLLLLYLIRPDYLGHALRPTATAARVSRQTVVDLRSRLIEWGHAVERNGALQWVPGARREALEVFRRGYQVALRSAWEIGRWDIDANVSKRERRIESQLRDSSIRFFGWGGSSTLRRLSQLSDRGGPVSVVFVDGEEATADGVARALGRGPSTGIYDLRVLGLPVEAAQGWADQHDWGYDLVHPVLTWAELHCDVDPRAAATADELADWLFPRLGLA